VLFWAVPTKCEEKDEGDAERDLADGTHRVFNTGSVRKPSGFAGSVYVRQRLGHPTQRRPAAPTGALVQPSA
jgi:hypothetical protein